VLSLVKSQRKIICSDIRINYDQVGFSDFFSFSFNSNRLRKGHGGDIVASSLFRGSNLQVHFNIFVAV